MLIFPGFIPQTDSESDSHMPSLQHRPLSLPQSHPERPRFLHDLASAALEQDGQSSQREDLDAIIHFLIEDASLPLARPTRNGVQIFLDLTHALRRSQKLVELEEVNTIIRSLRKLHDCPFEAVSVFQHAVTMSLIEMLAARVKGDARSSLEDIDEIVLLCRRLFTSDTPPDSLINAFEALTEAVFDAYSRGRQLQCLTPAIGCLREALKTCSSGFYQVSFDLANLLAVRFLTLQIDNDYQEAKAVLHNIILPRSPSAPPDAYQIQVSALTTALGLAQSIVCSSLKDLEGAVSRCRSFLESCSLFGNPLHPVIAELLVSLSGQKFKHIIPKQREHPTHSEVDRLPLSAQLGTLGDGVDGIDIVPVTLPTPPLENVDRLQNLTDDASEDAIKYNRGLPATAPHTNQLESFHPSAFNGFLYVEFNRSKRIEYLDESITLYREVLQLDSTPLTHFFIIQQLILSLSVRWQLFGRKHDLGELMCLFASGVKDTYTTVPSRFELACRWAHTARVSRHHSLSAAYKNVMSLMQSSLVFTPDLPIHLEKRDLYEKTPLNIASHHIRAGRLEQAVEALEHGRALLWSEMRGLRTSIDQLRAADPLLAKRFTAINQELEILTTSASSNASTGMDDGVPEGDKWTGQISHLAKRQHELLMERDTLISQIRGQPRLENFLLPLSFGTLRSAASNGPVIIINHCKWRSDILIVFHDSPPSHIPTPYDFFDRANRLKDRLLNTREIYGLDSEHYENALSFVLKGLYELVGRPVIERLKRLGIPEQSRVWWCPTSVFEYLPLHAMGPISPDSGDLRYFSDLYVSSYTPTLSALIASREPDPRASDLLTLLVSQPSPSMPGAWPDAEPVYDLETATSLSLRNTSSSTVLDGLQSHQFACVTHRGKPKTENPFEAAMWFFDGERLTLLDIVRYRRHAGESALLLGRHTYTAELTCGNMPDEALQLSAAVLFSGFSSVIGTMWGADDEDGQDLAEAVYRSMYLRNDEGTAYHEGSAMALQHAVQQLRSGLPLARWVNHVHYGA